MKTEFDPWKITFWDYLHDSDAVKQEDPKKWRKYRLIDAAVVAALSAITAVITALAMLP